MKKSVFTVVLTIIFASFYVYATACTSAIITGKVTANGNLFCGNTEIPDRNRTALNILRQENILSLGWQMLPPKGVLPGQVPTVPVLLS